MFRYLGFSSPFPVFQRYLIALLLFAVAMALRFSLFPAQMGSVFGIFYPAIVLAFYLCGMWPGILVVVLSGITADYIFIPSNWSLNFNHEDLYSLAFYTITALFIGLSITLLQFAGHLLDNFFTLSPIGKLALNQKGLISIVNPAFSKIVGSDLASVRKQPLTHFIADKDKARFKNEYQRLVQGRAKESQFTIDFQKQNGERAVTEVYATQVTTVCGRNYIYLNIVDITERKRAEAIAEQLNRDFVAFLDHTSDLVYAKDRGNHFKFCSQSLATIVGYSDWREVTGRHLFELFPQDTAQSYFEKEKPTLHQGIPLIDEIEPYYDAIGIKRWASTSKWPQYDNRGNIIGIFGISRDITAVQEAQQELALSEAKYKAILNDQTELICRHKADGTLLYVNEAFARYFGQNQESLIGNGWLPLPFKEDLPHVLEKLGTMSLENPIVTIENRVVLASGEIRWGQFVNRGFFDEEGNIIEIQCVGRDISAQHEQFLAASYNQSVIRNSNDAIITKTLDGTVTSWNLAAEKIFGYSEHEMINSSLLKLFPEDRKQEEDQILKRLSRGEKVDHFETQRIRKDGKLIDISVTISPIKDAKGVIVGASKIARDITYQKELESKLANALGEADDLYENAPCGYHTLSAEGRYSRANKTELNWLDYTHEDMIGKSMTDFFTPESSARFNKAFPAIVEKGHMENLEFEMLTKDGNVHQVSMNTKVILDAQGKLEQIRSTIFDITALKESELKLRLLGNEQEAMLNNDLVGIAKVRDRKITWYNRALLDLFGYDENELSYDNAFISYPDESAYEDVGALAEQMITEQGIFRAEREIVRKDGSKIWIDISSTRLPGDQKDSIWIMSDITSQREQRLKAERYAFFDLLTGLPNRLLIRDRLKLALAQAKRSGNFVAVYYLDLDGFKPVNDQFGHSIGDKVLVDIACRLENCIRASDTVGRLGGDEFLIIFPELKSREDHRIITDRLLSSIRKPIEIYNNRKVEVSVSIGIAHYPDDGEDPDLLVRCADWAMYKAKNSGRDQACIHEPNLSGLANQGRTLDS